MREFLDAIQPSRPGWYTELRVMRGGEVRSQFIAHSEREGIAAIAHAWDKDGWDVFYGVLPRTGGRGRAEDCPAETAVIIADIDNKNVGGTHLAALMRVGALNLQPSIIVDSGNGIHCYWLLRTLQPFTTVQPLMKGLQAAIGSDHVHDAPRVLRLPGTHNHKGCGEGPHDHPDSTYFCKPVRLLHFEPDRRYRLSDFDHFAQDEPPRYTGTPREGVLSNVQWEASSPSAPKFPEGNRNNELTRLAGIMAARNMPPIDMLAALLIENEFRCSPPLPAAEVERIVRSVSRYVRG